MTGIGPTSQRPQVPDDAGASRAEVPPPSSAVQRADRMSAANMLRSLLPLVVISLLIVGWIAFKNDPGDPVREVDPSTTIQLAQSRADHPVPVPGGLGEDYRPTSARTDAGNAAEGDAVTLQIGYLTPSGGYAGYVVSGAPDAEAVDAVLDGATEDGVTELGGEQWTRSTTERGETALSRVADGVTLVVTGSADDDELAAVAAAVRP
ncbi:DUF4245 domain-containing protein [Blastococcus sp. VKM Ac-2987]|uniref:DUF4245 domain-containing protein n=1 Tax=Blastococcus sp. VKM Ac-2987 TaxID=3004141 RepID=UPI0022AB70E4|nr:DUF4245 domain-containing protein [Blastococcus sp. VKM Ac-2987]MCZ2858031.1 DUF4245 domain-containing protein [Blastococcus sp. VKM Ac-2987]